MSAGLQLIFKGPVLSPHPPSYWFCSESHSFHLDHLFDLCASVSPVFSGLDVERWCPLPSCDESQEILLFTAFN